MVIKYHELTFPSIINNRQQQMIDNKNNLEGVEIHILILNISAAVHQSIITTMRETTSLRLFCRIPNLSTLIEYHAKTSFWEIKTL